MRVDSSGFAANTLRECDEIFLLSAHLEKSPTKERDKRQVMLLHCVEVETHVQVNNRTGGQIMKKNLSVSLFDDGQGYGLVLFVQVAKLQNRNGRQSLGRIGGLLDALEFVGLVNDGLEVLFTHCRAGYGEALSFFSLFFFEKGGVGLQYESSAVWIFQKEPFDHALKK